LCCLLTNGLEHGIYAEAKHPTDTSCARSIHGHRHDELTQLRPTALAGAVSYKLAEAHLTAEALLAETRSAILDDRKREAPGAGNWFVLRNKTLA
jgi:hypothetical protein